MTSCPKCGTEYQQVTDPDVGTARSICECEVLNKCSKCKRGQYEPINQARLDLDGDVRHYTCAHHGLMEAESFSIPAPPIGTKLKNVPKPTPPPAPVITNPESCSGMEILDRGWTVTKWLETKRAVLEDLKDPQNKYDVMCTESSCKFQHPYSKRKLEADDDRHSIRVVCPKCGHGGYRIL